MLARLHLVDLLLEVAVRLKEIEATVQVIVEEEETEAQHLPTHRSDAFGDRLVAESA